MYAKLTFQTFSHWIIKSLSVLDLYYVYEVLPNIKLIVTSIICFAKGDYRSKHQRCSIKKCVLKNFAKFTGNLLCWSLFFNEVADLRLWHRCFPMNFAKFLITPNLQNTFGRLLLKWRWLIIINLIIKQNVRKFLGKTFIYIISSNMISTI